jgi:hypothetical protein
MVTVTPVRSDLDERDPVAGATTVAADVATGLVVAVGLAVVPTVVPAADVGALDEQPVRTITPATSEPQAAAASR